MPGSPGASWAVYRARLKAVFDGADPRVCAAFWLFGKSVVAENMQRLARNARLTLHRPHQQCHLRNHPLCRSRPRWRQRAQRRRPPLRRDTVLLDQALRALFYTQDPVQCQNLRLCRLVSKWHAHHRPHTAAAGLENDCDKDVWYYACESEQWRW